MGWGSRLVLGSFGDSDRKGEYNEDKYICNFSFCLVDWNEMGGSRRACLWARHVGTMVPRIGLCIIAVYCVRGQTNSLVHGFALFSRTLCVSKDNICAGRTCCRCICRKGMTTCWQFLRLLNANRTDSGRQLPLSHMHTHMHTYTYT